MALHLPEIVQYNQELERALETVERKRERAGWLKHFDAELKMIDERLSLVRASDDADAPGLAAGYWHVRRRNDPPAMYSYMPICDEDGGFIEPHMGVLENLKKNDLQKERALDVLRRKQEDEIRARRRVKELAREDRVEEFAGRLKAIDSPGILFGDNKWTARTKSRGH